jgi:hypothetical protein
MKSPSVVAGTAFAAPISRAYDDPTPQQDEDSMVSNISFEKSLYSYWTVVWILIEEGQHNPCKNRKIINEVIWLFFKESDVLVSVLDDFFWTFEALFEVLSIFGHQKMFRTSYGFSKKPVVNPDP